MQLLKEIQIACRRVYSRPGQWMWMKDASHWEVTVTYNDASFMIHYSMGPAHEGEPEKEDVMCALLQDWATALDYPYLEDFNDAMGFDETDGEWAYAAIQVNRRKVETMFSGEELNELENYYENY